MTSLETSAKWILLGLASSYLVLFPNLNPGLTLVAGGFSLYAYIVAFRNLR